MEIKVHIEDHKKVGQWLKGEIPGCENCGERVTLLWSGGVDSTYMLCWLLYMGYNVTTLICDLDNSGSKNKREAWARGKVREKLISEMKFSGIWSTWESPVTVDIKGAYWRPNLAQAPVWLLAMQYETHPGDHIIAYVNGDDALHWIPAFHKVVEGYNMLSRPGHEVNLHFPLASIKKSWFYEALRPLYGLMTWCEMPFNRLRKNCQCVPCKRHRYELGEFE